MTPQLELETNAAAAGSSDVGRKRRLSDANETETETETEAPRSKPTIKRSRRISSASGSGSMSTVALGQPVPLTIVNPDPDLDRLPQPRSLRSRDASRDYFDALTSEAIASINSDSSWTRGLVSRSGSISGLDSRHASPISSHSSFVVPFSGSSGSISDFIPRSGSGYSTPEPRPDLGLVRSASLTSLSSSSLSSLSSLSPLSSSSFSSPYSLRSTTATAPKYPDISSYYNLRDTRATIDFSVPNVARDTTPAPPGNATVTAGANPNAGATTTANANATTTLPNPTTTIPTPTPPTDATPPEPEPRRLPSVPLTCSSKGIVYFSRGNRVHFKSLHSTSDTGVGQLFKLQHTDKYGDLKILCASGDAGSSSDGNSSGADMIAIATTRGTIQLWDVQTRKMVRSWGTGKGVGAMVFNHNGNNGGSGNGNGRTLTVGGEKGTLRIYDTRVAHGSASSSNSSTSNSLGSSSFGFSASGPKSGSGLGSGSTTSRTGSPSKKKGGTSSRKLTRHQSPITALAWNEPGRLLASGDESGAVFVWDERMMSERGVIGREKEAPLDVGVSGIGTGGMGTRGKKIQHSSPITVVSWCPWQPKKLGTADVDGTVMLWDVESTSARSSLSYGSSSSSSDYPPSPFLSSQSSSSAYTPSLCSYSLFNGIDGGNGSNKKDSNLLSPGILKLGSPVVGMHFSPFCKEMITVHGCRAASPSSQSNHAFDPDDLFNIGNGTTSRGPSSGTENSIVAHTFPTLRYIRILNLNLGNSTSGRNGRNIEEQGENEEVPSYPSIGASVLVGPNCTKAVLAIPGVRGGGSGELRVMDVWGRYKEEPRRGSTKLGYMGIR